jgi:hypothetical protein
MMQHARLIAATCAVALLGACTPASNNAASNQSANVAAAAPTNAASNQIVSASPAPAGGSGGGGLIQQACAADFQQLCPNFVWGTPGGLGTCMHGHYKAFSQPCKTALATARNKWQGGNSGQAQSYAPPISSTQ